MRQLHERMPVIVPQPAWDIWLDRTVTDPAVLADLFEPTPDGFLIAVPVSARVNNPRNNGPECVEDVGEIVR